MPVSNKSPFALSMSSIISLCCCVSECTISSNPNTRPTFYLGSTIHSLSHLTSGVKSRIDDLGRFSIAITVSTREKRTRTASRLSVEMFAIVFDTFWTVLKVKGQLLIADRSFDVRVEDSSGLGQQRLSGSLNRVSLCFVILGCLTFNVGQLRENARVGLFLGPRTHSVRQINASYMFLVTCRSVTFPITQTHRFYGYMHYSFRFNTKIRLQ
jgi:hypothetical protein